MDSTPTRRLTGIAREVGQLFGDDGVRSAFAKMVRESAVDLARQLRAWQDSQTEWQGRGEPFPPEDDTGPPRLVPVLQGLHRQDVSLAKKIVVLAAIHAAYGSQGQPLDFRTDYDSELGSGEPLVGAYFWLLVRAVSPKHLPFDSDDVEVIAGWVEEIRGYLANDEPDPSKETSGQKLRRRCKWLAEAMLLVQEHPEWSDATIAQEVGKSPSTLSRDRTYKAAAAMARQPIANRPRGHRNAKSGALEAHTDDEIE